MAALVIEGPLFRSGTAALGPPRPAPPASGGAPHEPCRAQASDDRGPVGPGQPSSPDRLGHPGRARRPAHRVRRRHASPARGATRHHRTATAGRTGRLPGLLSGPYRAVFRLLLVQAGFLVCGGEWPDGPRRGEAVRVEDDVGPVGSELQVASQVARAAPWLKAIAEGRWPPVNRTNRLRWRRRVGATPSGGSPLTRAIRCSGVN